VALRQRKLRKLVTAQLRSLARKNQLKLALWSRKLRKLSTTQLARFARSNERNN
jgi:hypothetical protein